MTKEEYLKLAEIRFDSIEALPNKASLLEYEMALQQTMTQLANDIMSKQLGGDGTDRRKKKRC